MRVSVAVSDAWVQGSIGCLNPPPRLPWGIPANNQHGPVLHYVSIVGYNFLRRTRASAVRNCQSMPVWAAWRASAHATLCAGAGPGASGRSVPVRPWGARCRAGRIPQTYARRQAARCGGRERVVERGDRMGVQVVADPGQAFGLTVARGEPPGPAPGALRGRAGRRRWPCAPGPAVPRRARGCRRRAARMHSRRRRAGPAARGAASALRTTVVWAVRPCRARDSAHRTAGRRDPAPLPSGPQRPTRAPGDSRAVPDARSQVRFFSGRRTVA